MVRQDNISETVIHNLKKDYVLVSDRAKSVDFTPFTLFKRGDNFRKLYQWRINIIGKSIYIITLNNSYRLNIVSPEIDGRVHTNDFKYLYCYFEFEKDFPDTIIRPNSLADKLSNSLFHFSIKIKDRPKFNDKYILESSDKASIPGLLNGNVISLFEDSSEFVIEIRDKKCLIINLRPINYEDSKKIIRIAEELMK